MLCLCLCLLWACSDGPTAPLTPAADLVAGVDLGQLFAPPTPEELSRIDADWQRRARPSTEATVVLTAPLVLGRRQAELHLLAYEVQGTRQYGALIAPTGAAPGSLPLVVYLHGGDQGVDIAEFLLITLGLGEARGDYAYALPAFRSEAIRYAGQEFRSEGEASPWDGDVDDALGLVAAALATEPALDPERLGAVGISRGGAVAMLMALREPRLKRVVEFFGPTDLLDEFGQEVAREALKGELRVLPGTEYLNRALLQPLRAGTLPMAEARLGLIRRSAVYFARRLPYLQVHHGTADPLVPVSQAERLMAVMAELGRSAPQFEAYLYPEGGHHPITLPGSLERAQRFLAPLRETAPAYLGAAY